MSDEQHKLSSSSPSSLDSSIPSIWRQEILAQMNRETIWNQKMHELGYHAAKLPIPPRHVRAWRTLKWFIARRREDLALKIAPWLEPDDWR